LVSFKQRVKEHFLPFANWFLSPLPIRLRGRGDPNRTFAEFVSHLRSLGIEFQTVIDVGVAYGTDSLYKCMPSAQFHLVEPVPAMLPVLQKIARRVRAEIHNVAAGSADGTLDFNIHPDVSGSSALNQVEGTDYDGRLHTVPVRRLDSIIPSGFAQPALLKIDTQGFEIEVLRGATGLLSSIDVIIIEASFHEFRHGAPEIFDIMREMEALGFVAYEILEGHYRPSDNAIAQVDVAFVPKDSALRAYKGAYKLA
jgi:FkbM family methyltransferase